MIKSEIQLPFYAKASIFFIGLVAFVAILYIAQGIIVPIVFSVIVAILLHPVVNFFVCPIPKFDFDVITLGHGSGGLLTHRLLQSGVFDILKNDLLDQQHDGASFYLEGNTAFSTDSYVISPIFFPGGDIGELAVNGTVNDLAMCGAEAKYLSLAFIVEEGMTMESFWQILTSIKYAADKAGVKIVTGDTKNVVEKGKGDQIFINTSGIGSIHPKAKIHHSRIEAGDQIILSGNLAQHGIAIMSKRQGLEFETDIVSDTTNSNT